MGSVIRKFVQWNIAVCDRIEGWLPPRFTRSLLYAHELTCAELMNHAPERVVLDVGGGHMCPYGEHRRLALGTRLYGLDILEEQVRANRVIDQGVVGDAQAPLPFADDAFDLVTSRSVMEHLGDNEKFVQEIYRILKPGGHTAHVFPSRFSPFAILNQLLPSRLAHFLLYTFFPKWQDVCGFKAYYRNCYYPRMIALFRRSGFAIEKVQIRYYQSIYYKMFLPLYLIMLAYDLALWLVRARPLAAQILLVARKPEPA